MSRWVYVLITSFLFVHLFLMSDNVVGNPNDVCVPTKGGVMLMGGGCCDDAIRWLVEQCNGGDFVVVTLRENYGYNQYVYDLGHVDSVETLLINDKSSANSEDNALKLRKAEAILLLGGDQAEYMRYLKDSKVAAAIEYAVNVRNVPLGGISAGLAILGHHCFSAMQGTITSSQALVNPFDECMTLGECIFKTPFLQNVITDTHYNQRNRKGRHVAFLARLLDGPKDLLGLGVDVNTAICISSDHVAKVLGTGEVYFLKPTGLPEICQPNKPLTWLNEKKAIIARVVSALDGPFAFEAWSEGKAQYWWVENGELSCE